MRPSQAEIKAIEAQLRSIRADSSVTLLDPNPATPAVISAIALPPISPKIEPAARPAAPAASAPAASAQTAKKRSVECFPIAKSNSIDTRQTSVQAGLGTQLAIEAERSGQRRSRSRASLSHHPQQAIARQLLAEKAHQINVLSTQQEAVILELITLSEQLESASTVCETAEVPHVDADAAGTLVLTSRSIEFPPVERRRRRSRNSHLMFASAGAIWQGRGWQGWGWLNALGRLGSSLISPLRLLERKPERKLRQVDRRASRRASGRRTAEEFTFLEAAILVLGSAMLRVGLDLLVASYPILWVPSLIVMLTPAAIAIYRSTLAPQTGFIWGYRLFSLMIGLLLGGRL